MDALNLITLALSTARVTRLVTTAKIAEPMRVAVIKRLKPRGMPAYLIVCDWCVSVYAGLVVTGAWYAWGGTRGFQLTSVALTLSYVAGFLNSKVDD